MTVKTEEQKAVVLEKLLSEAREEADALRRRLQTLEGVIESTRLIMGHELDRKSVV